VRVSTPPVNESGPEKVVGVTEPFALVERREFWTEEMARALVVAFVVVLLPTMLRLPFTVVEPTDTSPPLNVRVVDVAFKRNGYAKRLAAVT